MSGLAPLDSRHSTAGLNEIESLQPSNPTDKKPLLNGRVLKYSLVLSIRYSNCEIMKQLFLPALFLLPALQVGACTFFPEPFCATLEAFPERVILTGEIIAVDTTGITVAVLEVIRGQEERDTIRIWDGTDFDCFTTITKCKTMNYSFRFSIFRAQE